MSTPRQHLSGRFPNKAMAWTYSFSFPMAITALIALRTAYGYEWPLPSSFGLWLVAVGLASLARDAFSTRFFGWSPSLRRQALYSDAWLLVLGSWMYWKPFGDIGLVLLIALACALWPLSHLELQRQFGPLAGRDPAAS